MPYVLSTTGCTTPAGHGFNTRAGEWADSLTANKKARNEAWTALEGASCEAIGMNGA
jgi:hypothetical protein